MSEMEELALRCERANGPDADIDEAIWLEAGEPTSRMLDGTPVYGGRPPPFTASLDAAMTLVPEGCGFEVSSGYGDELIDGGHTYALSGNYDARVYTPRNGSFDVKASTAALALCAAALRAKSQDANG